MMKMDEFEEMCHGKEVKKKVTGVSKYGDKWRARARDPKLRVDVHLGSYSTPEEAALAVKMKKLEFEEMYKGEAGVGLKTCKGYFNGVKLPRGVSEDNGRWCAYVAHPKLRHNISCGSYETCEEAAAVAEMKRAELLGLLERNGEEAAVIAVMKKAGFLGLLERKTEEEAVVAEMKRAEFLGLQEPESEEADIVGYKSKAEVRDLVEAESEVASKSECLQEQTGGVNVVCGLSRRVARIRDPVARNGIWKKKVKGVTKIGNKWRARARDPKLRTDVHLGCYSTPEEAALAVKKKKLEFEEMYKGEDWVGLNTCKGYFNGVKLPRGVTEDNGRWCAYVCHPTLKYSMSCGSYKTCEEAAVVAEMKRVEFLGLQEPQREEADIVGNKRKADVRHVVEAESEVASKSECLQEQIGGVKVVCGLSRIWKKKVTGVTKLGNKLQARARDPKLRTDVHLGCDSTPEEAALAVKKKKLEFEEMYKGEDWVGLNTCKGYFNGVKLPRGVTAHNGRWYAYVWHPTLKYNMSCGSYKTCEEAAVVAEMKRAEFLDLWESKSEEAAVVAEKRRAEFQDLEVTESEVASKSKCLQEQTGGVKVACGVSRVKSGKWVAKIRDPVASSRIWIGTYDTADEAIRSFNKKKDLLAAKMTRAEYDGSEIRDMDILGSKTNEVSVKVEGELGYDSPSSSLGAGCLNNIAVGDDSRQGVRDTPGKVGNGFVHCSPTSVLEAENSNSASVSDKACALEFDKAVSSGLIDEYGQLLGQFKELDEQMPLSLFD